MWLVSNKVAKTGCPNPWFKPHGPEGRKAFTIFMWYLVIPAAAVGY